MAAPIKTTLLLMNRNEVQSLGGLKAVGSGPRFTRVAEAEAIREVVCMAEHCVAC